MAAPDSATASVQATVVAIDGRGVMLLGPPAVGKSDLALRLIAEGAALIGDDLVELFENGAWLMARARPQQRGKLFVSGIGQVDAERLCPAVRLSLVVHCCAAPPATRDAQCGRWRWRDLAVPAITLPALAASTPIKLRLALERWGL